MISTSILEVEPEKTKMIDGVYLYKYKQQTDEGSTYEWVVENLRFNNLNIKVSTLVEGVMTGGERKGGGRREERRAVTTEVEGILYIYIYIY